MSAVLADPPAEPVDLIVEAIHHLPATVGSLEKLLDALVTYATDRTFASAWVSAEIADVVVHLENARASASQITVAQPERGR